MNRLENNIRQGLWFIELDPENDKPRCVSGKYAIHHDSNVIIESEDLFLLAQICYEHNG
jgi:cytochrome oxidase Cu insertion factor (SCO1/SenC/PrrC family)